MNHLPDETVYHAVIAKKADVEFKRLRALATAWELEAAEKHAVLLQKILKNCETDYADGAEEASFFERLLVKRSRQQLEDDSDFIVAAYAHDLSAFDIADTQLEQLMEINAERKLELIAEQPPSEGVLNVQDLQVPTDSELVQEQMLEGDSEMVQEQMPEGDLEVIEKRPPSIVLEEQPASVKMTEGNYNFESVRPLRVGEEFFRFNRWQSLPSGDAAMGDPEVRLCMESILRDVEKPRTVTT